MVVLLDTHAWVWAIDDAPRLTARASDAIEAADIVMVSPISLYEVCQKVRLKKWPEMAVHVHVLPDLLAQQGILLAPLTADVMIRAGLLDWDHRDPFDRLIVATALVMGWPIVSADTAFDQVAGLSRIW